MANGLTAIQIGNDIFPIDFSQHDHDDRYPIISGDVENSAVLRGETTVLDVTYKNEALNEGCVSLGAGTTAGLKGWYYKAVQIGNDSNVVYLYLTTEQQIPIRVSTANAVENQEKNININISKGDICSIINGNRLIDCFEFGLNEISKYGRISFIYKGEGTNPLSIIQNVEELKLEDYSVFCISKPNCGIVELSKCNIALGNNTKSLAESSVSIGLRSTAVGITSYAEGQDTIAVGECSHAEGAFTKSNGIASHTEGFGTQTEGLSAHAEGYNTLATGGASHSEGSATKATGLHSHAEGDTTEASGEQSHAEGKQTIAEGEHSHSEGYWTKAHGKSSHVEGQGLNNTTYSVASGDYSHSEGFYTRAFGTGSHTEGTYTIAYNKGEHAEGIYNKSTENVTLHSVGIGTSANDRKNAHEITNDGKHYIIGVGGYDGTNFDGSEDVATVINDKLVKLSNITYSELVALRDNAQLIPGQQYRITDYETTTVQAGTTSAGHPFDVIVTALNESTLSENASAIRREDDTYFETENLEAWQLKYCLDNDTDRFAWANNISTGPKAEFVAMFWDDPTNGISYDQHIGNDKIYDWGIESDPDTDEDNIVLYKTNVESFANETDYNDKYFYRGVVEVDGEEYDSWQKFEAGEYEDWVTNDEGQCQYALTKRMVFDGQVIWPELEPEIIRIYDSSNCVIKDEYDSGPDDSGYNALSEYIEIAAIMMDDPVDGDPYEALDKDIFSHYGYETEPNGGNSLYLLGRYLDDGEDSGLCEDQKYYYRGVVSVDGSDFDCWQKYNANEEGYEIGEEPHKYYFLTNKIVDGDVTFTEAEKTYGGKGVIYNMIDEYGNECPYDFKNIKFYHDGLGTNVYTFTWIDESYNVMDTSVFGNNGTLTYYGEIYGVHGNVIKPYMEMMYDEDSGDYLGTKQLLNYITFISDYEYEGVGNEGFYGCNSNSFGNYCNSNSFGNYCNSNSFGNGCNYNSFGNYCNSNSFGNDCYYNSFGNYCNYNSFGNYCNSNSFGNDCYYNSFGNGCNSNSFGNYCNSNSFGNGCNSNSFGNYCNSNSFGNDCYYNSFGNGCNSNSFGNYCNYNSFRVNASKTATLLNYCQYNHFDDGCKYNVIWNITQPSSSNKLQNINVVRGVFGTYSAYNFINIVDMNAAYEIKVAKNSSGAIKIYCEADLIK